MTSKGEQVNQRISARKFDDAEVREALHDAPMSALVRMFGEPTSIVTYHQPFGSWKVGDGRPALADDDPAVVQAIGRCAASRVQGAYTLPSGTHPSECQWCPYPTIELMVACDWAAYMSRFIVTEILVWRKGPERPDRWVTYEREGRHDVYESPRWDAFYALSAATRESRIRAAMYETVAA